MLNSEYSRLLVLPLLMLFISACSELDSEGGQLDSDGDGIINSEDNCIAVANPEQLDFESDGLGDACDPDDDNDGAYDSQDDFPLDTSRYLDLDGDGLAIHEDLDNDGDGLEDNVDNCPYVANADQADVNGIDDGSGLGDACELANLSDTAQGISAGLDGGSYDSCDTSQDDGDLQDCAYGRDALQRQGLLAAKTGAGIESFDYSKVGADGSLLAADASSWYCVLDHATGLLWERKRSGDGADIVNYQKDKYFWYMPDIDNGDVAGIQDDVNKRVGTGIELCRGFDDEDSDTWCNTQAFLKRMNEANYCGHNDWRLPTLAEMTSITNMGPPRTVDGDLYDASSTNRAQQAKSQDIAYFTYTQSARYWTSDTNIRLKNYAWVIWGNQGHSQPNLKEDAFNVRLVRDTNND